ncbi:MAG: nodulation protein NfeD [Chloroflexi bacterium]|nr:nodulation protein NfeD [Chloroflexota bacterium]
MLKIVRFLLLSVVFASALIATSVHADAPFVYVLKVDGTVNPTLVSYIDRGITRAEEDGAAACIIELNTPGGLLSSTEDIVSRISQASVPVVVYVPSSGWAASAGAFITLAADVAAMGPGSVIGASTPIAGGGGELSGDERSKAVNLARQWMKSIAEEHGRNEEAAMAAVTEAASFSPAEASGMAVLSRENQEILGVERLDPPLIDDAGAVDIEELMERLSAGITLANGETFTIPAGVSIRYINMSALERFLFAISDPNIAYILLSIGALGILVELLHPGIILPGVMGGVCLLLGIYSLGMLGANYAGTILIILAFALFVAEAFTTTFGLLFAGGIISLVSGSLLLFSGTPFEIDPWLIAVVVAFFSAIAIFLITVIVRAHRSPITTGREGLIGQTAVTRTPLDPKGTVFVEGETWNAWVESGTIEAGEEVVVTQVEGLRLKVVKKSKQEVK